MQNKKTKSRFFLLIIRNSCCRAVSEKDDYHLFINSLSKKYGTEIYFDEFDCAVEKPFLILLNTEKEIICNTGEYNWEIIDSLIQKQEKDKEIVLKNYL